MPVCRHLYGDVKDAHSYDMMAATTYANSRKRLLYHILPLGQAPTGTDGSFSSRYLPGELTDTWPDDRQEMTRGFHVVHMCTHQELPPVHVIMHATEPQGMFNTAKIGVPSLDEAHCPSGTDASVVHAQWLSVLGLAQVEPKYSLGSGATITDGFRATIEQQVLCRNQQALQFFSHVIILHRQARTPVASAGSARTVVNVATDSVLATAGGWVVDLWSGNRIYLQPSDAAVDSSESACDPKVHYDTFQAVYVPHADVAALYPEDCRAAREVLGRCCLGTQ
jgi:hypothetical protein